MSILVVDVGTSGVRAAVVRPDGAVEHVHHRQVLPESPAPGFVQFDAAALAAGALAVASEALAAGGPVEAVGIAAQRASTVVWDRDTGEPVGPAIGWQDLRTVGMCLMLQAQDIRIAPNASATKVAALLDIYDPGRERNLAFGTVDCWLAWTLSAGALHVTDMTNAAVTGLGHSDAAGWAAPSMPEPTRAHHCPGAACAPRLSAPWKDGRRIASEPPRSTANPGIAPGDALRRRTGRCSGRGPRAGRTTSPVTRAAARGSPPVLPRAGAPLLPDARRAAAIRLVAPGRPLVQ